MSERGFSARGLGAASADLVVLALLTAAYVLGELGHFLLGVTSRDIARDLHYGDAACFTLLVKSNSSDVVSRPDVSSGDENEEGEVRCNVARNSSQ